MIKPTLFVTLAVAAVLSGSAFAQQSPSAPVQQSPSTPVPPAASQDQPRPNAANPSGDDRRPRWRSEGDVQRGDPGEERLGRWNRRPFDRDEMGERMMPRRFGMGRFCGPSGEHFAEAMLDRMERATRPTAEQKPAFDKLKEAANKAAEIVRAACPAEVPVTPPNQLAATEKRLTAMLEAVRMVRPPMEAFYGSLSDEQKARFYMSRRPMMMPTGPREGERLMPDRGEPRDLGRPDRSRRWGDRDQNRPDDQEEQHGDRTNYDHSGDEAQTRSQSL